MKTTLKYTLAASAVAALTACGGGGGGGGGSSQSGVSTGDYFTYSVVRTPTGATSGSQTTQWFTRYMSDVKSNGAFTTALTYGDSTLKVQYDMNDSFQETSWLSSTTTCTNSPMVDSPSPPFTVGKTWDIRYTRTCLSSNTSSTRSERNYGSVVSEEKKSVPAGTFDAVKMQYTRTSSFSDGTWEYNYICWREKENDRTIACDYTYKYTPTGAAQPTQTYAAEQRLQYFNVTTGTQNKNGVARFAGDWTLSWTGSNTGTCRINAGVTGTITGTCYPSEYSYLTYSLTGSVNNDGVLSVIVSSGATINGRLNNPLTGSGSWTNTGTSGSWNATHN